MRRTLAFAVLLFVSQLVLAQTASMPQPVAVVKDADGKVMAQVAGFMLAYTGEESSTYSPVVLLDVDGTPASLLVMSWGLVDPVHWAYPGSTFSDDQTGSVYFTSAGCGGAAYVNPRFEHPKGGGEPDSGEINFGVARSTPKQHLHTLPVNEHNP